MTEVADARTEVDERDLEPRYQCERCGSSVEWIDCHDCGGDGWVEYDDGDGIVPDIRDDRCGICGGKGGWFRCVSTPKWCNENPIAGREDVVRGAVEKFMVRAGG